jgi:hypothetical protein
MGPKTDAVLTIGDDPGPPIQEKAPRDPKPRRDSRTGAHGNRGVVAIMTAPPGPPIGEGFVPIRQKNERDLGWNSDKTNPPRRRWESTIRSGFAPENPDCHGLGPRQVAPAGERGKASVVKVN